MRNMMKTLCVATLLAMAGSLAVAKLPAPSDEAKAKAAEAAAKTAWVGKVDNYKLCLSQDKVVAYYKKAPVLKDAKAPAKGASAPAGACADPGPFVYPPAAPAAAASGAAPVPVAAPAASAASQAKKS
jgi:hypothetical protein